MLSLLSWFLIMSGIAGGMGYCWHFIPREYDHDAFFRINRMDSDSDDDIYERIPYHMRY